MATIKYRQERDTWEVRWRELVVTTGPEGVTREWAWRRKSCPTQATAKALARKIEERAALGEGWVEEREQARATLRGLALAYVRAAVDAGAPARTQAFRSAMVGAWLDWLDAREEGDRGSRRLVGELSLTLLQDYARALPGGTRGALSTRHRKVLEVERLWVWGHDRPEAHPGVPPPRRYSGQGADKLSAPPPVVALASPTWADVDSMLSHLEQPWHRRAGLLMRYTGIRASQATGMTWEDLDLERGILHLAAGRVGAKKGRGRVVPLAPALVEEMKVWAPAGERTGLLFPRRYRGHSGPYRGDALVEPYRRAWLAAGVPEARWGAPPGSGREHASPSHAIRRCIRTQLIRAGVEEALVLHLVGQSQGHTAAAYVPEDSPEESPYWPRLVLAVALIPPHS